MLTTIAMWSLVPAREGGGQLSYGLLFWLIVLFALLFGGFWYWPGRVTGSGYGPFGSHLLVMILIVILGIGVFGWPLGGG
jgi:hypothetical protein